MIVLAIMPAAGAWLYNYVPYVPPMCRVDTGDLIGKRREEVRSLIGDPNVVEINPDGMDGERWMYRGSWDRDMREGHWYGNFF